MRSVHEDLMKEVNCKAQYISNKYNKWINPSYFEWDKFIPTLKDSFRYPKWNF